jgi:hypothetical protein
MHTFLRRATEWLGILSFLSLIVYFLALNDIFHEYVGTEIWSRAGEPAPAWLTEVSRCLPEWTALQAGFVIMIVFHMLFFAASFTSRRAAIRRRAS